jgi:hypothetical protein
VIEPAAPLLVETLAAEVAIEQPRALPSGTSRIRGVVTHYGVQYNGRSLGCGTGYYTSSNVEIAAVGPARYRDWPCGTAFMVCGPGGCVRVVRHDACPGCSANQLDLSEAGLAAVCGPGSGRCSVEFQVRR